MCLFDRWPLQEAHDSVKTLPTSHKLQVWPNRERWVSTQTFSCQVRGKIEGFQVYASLWHSTHSFWHLKGASASWYLEISGFLVPHTHSGKVQWIEIIGSYNCKVRTEQVA